MTNETLLLSVRSKAQAEQKLTLEVIELIALIDRRRLFLSLGYSSLFDFLTKDLRFEPSSAMRRIQAARLINEIPQIKENIKKKELTLSVLSKAQSFFHQQKNETGIKPSRHSKIEVLNRLKNKSVREAEKELVKINPKIVKKKESARDIGEDLVEIKIVVDSETRKKIEELKTHLAHQNPDLSLNGLFKLLIHQKHQQVMKSKGLCSGDSKGVCRDKSNRLPKEESTVSRSRTSMKNSPDNAAAQQPASAVDIKPTKDKNTENNISIFNNIKTNETKIKAPMKKMNRRRVIPRSTRRLVWERDEGKCQFINSSSKKKCESKAFLELDHIVRVRNGGDDNFENLRLLCRNHNQMRG